MLSLCIPFVTGSLTATRPLLTLPREERLLRLAVVSGGSAVSLLGAWLSVSGWVDRVPSRR